LMGGEVGFTSAEHIGSRFYFRLDMPLKLSAVHASSSLTSTPALRDDVGRSSSGSRRLIAHVSAGGETGYAAVSARALYPAEMLLTDTNWAQLKADMKQTMELRNSPNEKHHRMVRMALTPEPQRSPHYPARTLIASGLSRTRGSPLPSSHANAVIHPSPLRAPQGMFMSRLTPPNSHRLLHHAAVVQSATIAAASTSSRTREIDKDLQRSSSDSRPPVDLASPTASLRGVNVADTFPPRTSSPASAGPVSPPSSLRRFAALEQLKVLG
jgi:hypothetical protein